MDSVQRFLPPLRFRGTLAPARRASLNPIAMACLRLVTFLPERPDLSVPRLRSCIARFTLLCAFLPYLAMSDEMQATYPVRFSGGLRHPTMRPRVPDPSSPSRLRPRRRPALRHTTPPYGRGGPS